MCHVQSVSYKYILFIYIFIYIYIYIYIIYFIDFFIRYRPSLDIRFLADELGFEGDQDCIDFMKGRGIELKMEDRKFKFDTKAALPIFEALKASLTKVDLKGQL